MQFDQLKRREFITLLGGAAAWPLAARAQQGEKMRRIGVLMNLAVGDPEGEARVAAFLQALQQLGWSDGRNVRIDYRWAVADVGRFHRYAEELVALAPDAILASGTPSVQALQQVTRTGPIVFAQVIDPVGIGFVASLARPGGNITGFSVFEYGLSGKWLELLKEIAPRVTRVAVLRDLTIGLGQLGAIQSVAPSLGVELTPIGVGDVGETERTDRRRPDLLRGQFDRRLPPRRWLRRSHPQGREARRPPGAGADQVRVGHQPEDREGARPRSSNDAACPRR
jgi:ABC-type uncharacterized transport system substrate-binding protein